MLYFSKLRIISILLFTITLSFFTVLNFIKLENSFLQKKINLGLDLQGGSYLLLEIDNEPVIKQKLQSKLLDIRKLSKTENLQIKNLKLDNNVIYFETTSLLRDKVEKLFEKDDSDINPYYQNFKSHELNLSIEENLFILSFSDYGLVLLKNSTLDQAIEIVRRRVDELGTNEPNIVKRGNDRILVELPGLDDPARIKNLLGKTANLTFQFVSKSSEESFGTQTLKYDEDDELEEIVSKKPNT